MSKRIFTREQIEELLQNKYVSACSERSITYHKDFKVSAVKKYQEGMPASEIFKEAGFNIALIGSDIPSACVRRWRKTFKEKGDAGFIKEMRGGPGRQPHGKKDMADLSEKEKLKYLEAEVAYLKAENAFLAKLRKQRLN